MQICTTPRPHGEATVILCTVAGDNIDCNAIKSYLQSMLQSSVLNGKGINSAYVHKYRVFTFSHMGLSNCMSS